MAVVGRYRSNITLTDTQLDHHVSIDDRALELKRMIDIIRNSELVITDRLHGMIFCAITSTPCIVMSNYNYKVSGVYEWIKDLKYVSFLELDDASSLDYIIRDMLELKREDCKYDREGMLDKFLPLKEVLVNE
jgi:pyruvyl transferase EpsI